MIRDTFSEKPQFSNWYKPWERWRKDRYAADYPSEKDDVKISARYGLIKGDKSEGYYKTEKGEIWHDILKKHSDLVGVLTRILSGDRLKRC